jgi:hypothetical protein
MLAYDVQVRVFMYACMHACICPFAFTCACRPCVLAEDVQVRVFMHACMHACVCVCMYVHVHVCF